MAAYVTEVTEIEWREMGTINSNGPYISLRPCKARRLNYYQHKNQHYLISIALSNEKIILVEVYCSDTGSFVTDRFYVQCILPIHNQDHLSYSIQTHSFSIIYRITSLNLIWLNMMNWIWFNIYLNFCHKLARHTEYMCQGSIPNP